MAGTTDAGFNITHLLPIELLQKVFRFSKLMEPPVFPDTTDGTHEFKSLWAWPVSVKGEKYVATRQGHVLGWIKVSHVSHRWREVRL